jgi:predicted pyridoxine 5'-phosphate oxidase superfamily flavin-nucleotide-binding protein
MSIPHKHASDVAFSPSVKSIQARKGSRRSYARMEESGGWDERLTDDLAQLIAVQTSVFLATASADGQPYIQHRGGPPGFLRVIDEKTLGFVDFAGNRQYITQGNLLENPRVCLFIMDYAHQQRVKIWGEARVVEGDAELIAQLMPKDYKAKAEQVILISVSAWDANCPQHIPQKFDAADVARTVERLEVRIAELEGENERLRQRAELV